MRNPNAKISFPNDFISNPGNRFKVKRTGVIQKDGTIKLRTTETIDLKEEINSYREMTDMRYIIDRLLAGDDSVLNSNPPMYGDFTKIPRTYAEMAQLVNDANEFFDRLPVEVKKLFDNDRLKWFASVGTDEWYDKMSIVGSKETPTVDVGEAEKEVSE